MKCALIGLGMVSKTYGDAIANCETVDLTLVYARSPDAREAFLSDWPQLNARAASGVDEIAASDPATDLVELAARWGFPDVERFSRRYRSEYGEAPGSALLR